MRTYLTIAGGAALLGAGYVLGAAQVFSPAVLLAQADAGKKAARASGESQSLVDVSDEARTKIKAAGDALQAAMEVLVAENKYNSAIKGVNAFAVLSGGTSGQDLEQGIVDPETYAALYVGLATDTVAPHLGRDADGRLTYKGKLLRMSPISAIRAKYAARAELTGEEILPTPPDTTRPAAGRPKADESDESDADAEAETDTESESE